MLYVPAYSIAPRLRDRPIRPSSFSQEMYTALGLSNVNTIGQSFHMIPSSVILTEDEEEKCGENHYHKDLDAQVVPPWYPEVANMLDRLSEDDCH